MVEQGELASLRKPNEEVAPRAHTIIRLSSLQSGNNIFSGSQIGRKLGFETVDGSITIQERKYSQRLY